MDTTVRGKKKKMFNEPGIFLILTAVLIIAVVGDIRFHKIPNALTYPAMLAGIAWHGMVSGVEGVYFSLGGIGAGIALLIVFFLLGGMGAGDVKPMGAVGGFLGPDGVFAAVIFTALIGGVYALILLGRRGHLKDAVKRYSGMVRTFIATGKLIYAPAPGREEDLKLWYGIAIALGTTVSMGLKII